MTARLAPEVRTEQLLDVALRLAESEGFHRLTRDEIARRAGVATGLVSTRLGTMDQLRRAVMRRAVTQRCVPVVAQGLAAGDKHAAKADQELKDLAAAWVKR